MICPNCKSNIPDDSKFCPDCGTPVVNIEELRTKAKEITIQYKKGYDFYVNDGILPRFVYNITTTNCEKIIDAKNSIIVKHHEIEALEKKQEKAFGIVKANPLGYAYMRHHSRFPHIADKQIGEVWCDRIIANESGILRKEKELKKEEDLKNERLRQEAKRQYEILKQEALEICKTYDKGYKAYLNNNGLTESFDEVSCKKIIENKRYIIRKHNQIVDHARQQSAAARKAKGYESNKPDEMEIQRKASNIAKHNYQSYCFYAQSLGYAAVSKEYLALGKVIGLADSKVILNNSKLIQVSQVP